MSVQLQDVVNQAWRETGQQPGTSLPTATSNAGVMLELIAICEFINKAMRRVWNLYPWPESIRMEQRFFAPVFNQNTVYEPGAQIYDPLTQGYWTCILTTNPGYDPTSNPTYWTALATSTTTYPPPSPSLIHSFPLTSPNQAQVARLDITGITYGTTPLSGVVTASSAVPQGTIYNLTFTGFSQYWQLLASTVATDSTHQRPADYNASTNAFVWYLLSTDGMGETTINQITKVYNYDPRTSTCAQEIAYKLINDRVYVDPRFPYASAWPEIKNDVPVFSLVAWNPVTIYSAGTVVFYGGDSYLSLKASTGATPSSSSLYWSIVTFPARFMEYAALQASAQWKSKAGLKETDLKDAKEEAEMALQELMENLVLGENQGNFLPQWIGRQGGGYGYRGYGGDA